jgi:hypothetical protein
MSARFQVRGNCLADFNTDHYWTAVSVACAATSGNEMKAASIFDRHCTMIIERYRNGRSDSPRFVRVVR